MISDNEQSDIIQLPFKYELFLCSKQINLLCFHFLPLNYLYSILTFTCSWFKLLFADRVMMFLALKGRKQCSPIGFLF